MSRFIFKPLSIPGLVAFQRRLIGDVRGSVSRLFCTNELGSVGWHWPVLQINHSCTNRAGTVRGLHYQRPPNAEGKIVTCLRGRVWDVAVDLRSGSSTFLQWCAQELSPDNLTSVLIPPGCAHGFQALTADVELLYVHSSVYAPEAEGGLRATDPQLNIPWPLPPAELSLRDREHPLLDEDFVGLDVS